MVNKIGIIKKGSIDEIIFDTDKPKLIFGLDNAPAQKKERKSIGHALVKTGLEVYATDTKWPNDSYVSNNGLYLPERYFGDLAHGGNYIFGEGFILVSDVIKDDLEKKLKDSKYFKKFFSGSEVVFVPNYEGVIYRPDGKGEKLEHIDLTIGYIPKVRLLFVDEKHYDQERKKFEGLVKKFGININITSQDDFSRKRINDEVQEINPKQYKEIIEKYGPDITLTVHDNHFPNNFYVVQYYGEITAITNKHNNPFKNTNKKFKVIETEQSIENLPLWLFGSVKCAVNISPTTELWDKLEIKYERWGVNPKQINYAMH